LIAGPNIRKGAWGCTEGAESVMGRSGWGWRKKKPKQTFREKKKSSIREPRSDGISQLTKQTMEDMRPKPALMAGSFSASEGRVLEKKSHRKDKSKKS